MHRPNTTFDIFLNASLPPSAPDVQGQRGHLKDRFEQGSASNEGSDRTFLWTATLEVPLEVDLPDGYPSGAFQTTIYVPDSNGTPYTVVFTERERDFRGNDFKRVYLIKGINVALTVEEVDGNPSYTSTTKLLFNQADGFTLSQPAANQAQVSLASASPSQKGAMDTAAQSFQGLKTFITSIVVGRHTNDYQLYLDRGSGVIGLAIQTYASGSYTHNLIWAKSFADFDGFTRLAIGLAPNLATGAGVCLELSSEYDSAAMSYFAVMDGDGNIYSGTTGTFAGLEVAGGLIVGDPDDFEIDAGDIPDLSGTYALASHTHTSSDITDFTAAVQAVGDARYSLLVHSHAFADITATPTTLSGYGITDGQPLDGDLTALAALSGTNTIYYRSAANTWTAVTIGSNLTFAGGTLSASGGGSGTVTSVAMTVPSILSVSGSPITTSGTFAVTLENQSANTVFAGPTSGGAATPTFRALVVADLPDFNGFSTASVADGDQFPFSDVSATANKKIAASTLRQYMVPPGTVMHYAGSSTPSGWLNCDGSAVSRSTYADLFSAIGTTWGAGNGSTTFNVPDLRGRAIVGVGTGSGLSARNLGSSGGNETHTLATGEIPAHSHGPGLGSHFLVRNNGASSYAISTAGANIDTENCTGTASAGGGGSHNNMQPFANLYHIIKT